VTCTIKGGTYVVRYPVEKGLDLARKVNSRPIQYSLWSNRNSSKFTDSDISDLMKFADAIEPFKTSETTQLRCEGSVVQLFTSSKDELDNIKKIFTPWIKEITEPETDKDLKFLLGSDSIKVLVSAYPREYFKFKVILKNTFKYDEKLKFISWIAKYSNTKILPSTSTFMWLSDHKRYLQDPFVYVADEQMLLLIELYLGKKLGRIEEYVLKSDVV